ncbi:MAG: gamma-glutamyltransferase, partial [Alphaproteobacteria bacterium]
MTAKGAIAAGNPDTARAAADILAAGGNAFDAALAALCAACVAEPVLASLGGGGFLLARPAEGRSVLYDFFTQTPIRPRPPGESDFYARLADFGAARQEFHIGLGSIATPGVVKGLFAAHRDLGALPMRDIVAPAVAYARDGVRLDPLQAFINRVVETIVTATPAARAIFCADGGNGALLGEGDSLRMPAFADALEALADEGEALFYQGDIAKRIARDCGERGGHLTAEDLAGYEVIRRQPLARDYRGSRLITNPPPSSGGVLIAFALDLVERADVASLAFGGAAHLDLLARVMEETNRARIEARIHDLAEDEVARRLLDPGLLARYADEVHGQPASRRGTTHISVIDGAGNAAALSVSNGEGSAYVVPGTGIMLNNMLGEEDVNPQGFHNWPPARRISSMMAPTLVEGADGGTVALGSGGSNRIRTAILQVLVNLLDFGMDIAGAVTCPRVHFEGGVTHVEHGFDVREVAALTRMRPDVKAWPDQNIFFGGVHAVTADPATGAFRGAGDPRRGG